MTGTTVKNAGAILQNLTANTAKSAKSGAASESFQTVWNSQMGKNAQNTANEAPKGQKPATDSTVQDSAKRGEATQTGAKQEVRTDDRQPVDKGTAQQPEAEELSPEELETAMETLGTAAVSLMQKIAEVFDIPMEELQGEMEQLGLEALDLLQAPELGRLILKLGGAEDASALLTDEALCGSFKAVMEQLNVSLEETAKELGLEPEQLKRLLAEQKPVPEDAQTIPADAIAGETAVSGEVPDGRASGKPDTDKAAERRSEEPIAREAETAEIPTEKTVSKATEAGERRGGEKQSGKEPEGGQRGEVFAQEFKTVQTENSLQQTQGAAGSSPWNADTQDIMRQIMDYMRVQLDADTTNLEMQLHPESLGTLRVQVESKAGVLTANFITQNEAVKAALESQMVQLRENFEEQGVKVEAIEVTVQAHAFERNLDQGREGGQGSGEPSRRARVRRISLNDLPSAEDMAAEDALAAEMLAAGGSTVDYTA